jgi:glycosyltransferase involved in cell wall biosynthesis
MIDVLLDWHLGDNFGWGLAGLHLFAQWANDRELTPLSGQLIERRSLGLTDPLRVARMVPAIEASNARLARGASTGEGIVIEALGNGLAVDRRHRGRVHVARCVFEDTALGGARAALATQDQLLVVSQWNAHLLEAATGRPVRVVPEGVDVAAFCPGPRSGVLDASRFHVFSGGKVEFRKGQDLVLAAFRRFRERHDDAVLVTAWQSIWPHRSVGFRGRLEHAVEASPNGLLDIGRWAARNGIDPGAVIDLGLVPNALMPTILREMDVALQPSRAEGGTNLPVKEAMACGVPVIAGLNTGMLELLHDDSAIPLRRQRSVVAPAGLSTEGWGESEIDEIVEALEFAYTRRDEARARGLRARDRLIAEGRTWQAHAAGLKRWLLGLS